MPMELTYGMVSQVPSVGAMSGLDAGLSFGGYLTPALDGMHDLGATFWKDQVPEGSLERRPPVTIIWLCCRSLCDGHFLRAAEGLGARMSRCASLPDRRPLSGRLSEGLFVFGGLGARGFTLGRFLATFWQLQILARPAPLPRDQLAGIGPLRYAG